MPPPVVDLCVSADEVLRRVPDRRREVFAIAKRRVQGGLGLTGRVEASTQQIHIRQVAPAVLALQRVQIRCQLPAVAYTFTIYYYAHDKI